MIMIAHPTHTSKRSSRIRPRLHNQSERNGRADSLLENVQRCYPLGWSFTPLDGKVPLLAGWQRRERESLEDATPLGAAW